MQKLCTWTWLRPNFSYTTANLKQVYVCTMCSITDLILYISYHIPNLNAKLRQIETYWDQLGGGVGNLENMRSSRMLNRDFQKDELGSLMVDPLVYKARCPRFVSESVLRKIFVGR